MAWGASRVDRLVTSELRLTRAARALSRSGAYWQRVRCLLGGHRSLCRRIVWLLSVWISLPSDGRKLVKWTYGYAYSRSSNSGGEDECQSGCSDEKLQCLC